MRFTSLALLLFFLAAGCGTPVPSPPVQGAVYSFGRFGGDLGTLRYRGVHVFRGYAPTDHEPIETTTEIPCELGERFGAFFIVELYRPAKLKIRWEHPHIDDPARKVVGTVTEYPTRVRPSSSGRALTFGGWAFDDPDDLVDGSWRVSLIDRGITVASQSFQTTGCP